MDVLWALWRDGKFRRTFYGKWLIFLDIPAVIRLTTMPRSASQDLSRKRKMGLHSLVIIYQPNLSGRTLVPTITTFLSISNFKYICTSTYNEKWFCYLRMFPPHFKRDRRYVRSIRTIFLSSLSDLIYIISLWFFFGSKLFKIFALVARLKEVNNDPLLNNKPSVVC